MTKASRYVFGVNRGHNGSVVLLKDGMLVAGIEIERLERLKYANGNYVDHAIHYCLDKEKISLDDVELIVTNSSFCRYEEDGKNKYVSHHLAHAYSVAALSGFDECNVIVADGSGNRFADLIDSEQKDERAKNGSEEAESVYSFKENDIKKIKKRFCEWNFEEGKSIFDVKSELKFNSMGHAYSLVSKYLFGRWEHSGKTMGLSAHGKEKRFSCMNIGSDGGIDVDISFIDKYKNPGNFYYNLKDNTDMAFTIQKEYEDALIKLAKYYQNSTKSRKLCISGGCGLNVVANSKVLTDTDIEDVFVSFAPGDDGIAIGAAYYGWMKIMSKEAPRQFQTPYLGKEYSDSEIRGILEEREDIVFKKIENKEKLAATLISQGNIIGWFQGGSEFGPRALGNRSILADPRDPKMKERLNQKVKHREAFRPFAPAILEEDVEEYFVNGLKSPYMTFIDTIKEDKRKAIPSVVHVDGTGRLQTVSKDTNEIFYNVIKEFKELTGIPVIINTSFNDNEPIVETPFEALGCFLNTDMDYLIIGDYFIEKIPVNKKDILLS